MDKKRKYSIIQDEFDSLKDANYLLHADNKVKSD